MKKRRPPLAPMKTTDRFAWGKYRGRELWRVMATDPAYVWWLVRNLDGFQLDERAARLLAELKEVGL